jgi:hypothetical protein
MGSQRGRVPMHVRVVKEAWEGRGLAERRCDLVWGILIGNLYLSGGWLVRCKSEKGHHNEHAFKIKETCVCVCVRARACVRALLMAQF